MIEIQRRNGYTKTGGIIDPTEVIHAIKFSKKEGSKSVVCALMLKDNHLPEIFAVYNKNR